jgi:hypothetical protein
MKTSWVNSSVTFTIHTIVHPVTGNDNNELENNTNKELSKNTSDHNSDSKK